MPSRVAASHRYCDGLTRRSFLQIGGLALGGLTLENLLRAEELAGMWNSLPLDDRGIAERLGITRQQVINLRKSARARLARRMVIQPGISHL